MSTYKSLGGPSAGLVLTSDETLAQTIDAIAFPGLTANFDVAKTAALAITLADWMTFGAEYATAMIDSAITLARGLDDRGVPVFTTSEGPTQSHALALDVRSWGGGHPTALHLRRANLLTSTIGLPSGLDDGLRIGVNEIVRWGAGPDDMDPLAELMGRALGSDHPESMAADVSAFRRRFPTLHYIHC
jgi:glycine hydroxymethyltransferase